MCNITKLLTSTFVASCVRYCLMLHILNRLNIADLHFCFMWCLKLNVLSIHAPKNQMISLRYTTSSQTLILPVWHLCSCCLDPINIKSIFQAFSLGQFHDIHSLMSCIRYSMTLTALSSEAGLFQSNPLFNEWSSVKLLGLTSSSTSSICRSSDAFLS